MCFVSFKEREREKRIGVFCTYTICSLNISQTLTKRRRSEELISVFRESASYLLAISFDLASVSLIARTLRFFRGCPLATPGEKVRGDDQCSFDDIKGHLAANVSGYDNARVCDKCNLLYAPRLYPVISVTLSYPSYPPCEPTVMVVVVAAKRSTFNFALETSTWSASCCTCC